MRFELEALPPISQLPDDFWVVVAKSAGAVLGSAISLVYVLPKGRREAAARFVTGVSVGILFGPAVGVWIIDQLHLSHELSRVETVMTGAAAASLCAWWALGVLRRLFENLAQTKHIK